MEKNKLESFTTMELVQELKRRLDELDQARALLLGSSAQVSGKNPRLSGAKAAYWKDWHDYKAQHLNATVEEWRKSQRKGR